MKSYFCLLLLTVTLGLSSSLNAVGGVPWLSGRVELTSGDWLTGALRYHPDLHLLEFSLDGTVQAFSPQKVASFTMYDPEAGHHRTFVTREAPAQHGRSFARFFEVLVDGRVQLLAHEEEQHSSVVRHLVGRGSNRYFLQYPDGHLVAYRGRVGQLYALLADHQPEVTFFMQRVNWFHQEEKPIAELVRFYNSLGQ